MGGSARMGDGEAIADLARADMAATTADDLNGTTT